MRAQYCRCSTNERRAQEEFVYPEGKTVLAGSVYPEMFVTAVKLPTVTLSAGLHTAVETTTHRSATLTINNYQVHTRLVNLDVEDCSEELLRQHSSLMP